MAVTSSRPSGAWIVLHWTARITAALSIALILLFFAGTGFSPSQVTSREALLLLFFPFGVALGMVLGWWREGAGGIITLLALAGFYLVHYVGSGRTPVGPWFAVLSLPGFLFLVSALARPGRARRGRKP